MSRPPAASGQRLVDAVELPEATLNLLFAALLLTAGGCFSVGNLRLLDSPVLQRSGQIALACLALLLIFYTLARSLGSVTWGLTITYVLILVMTYGRQPWLIPLVYVFAACGFLYTLRFLRVARHQWGLVLLMGAIGTATAVTSGWISMTSFDMLHRLHVPGGVQSDTLFFASISAMIKHYGVVSTGLHGLVETSYHVLSHTLMAGLSLLSGTGAIEVYGVAPAVLFVPILIFSIAACAAMLDQEGRSSVPIAWGLVCILLVGVPILLGRWLSSGYFISESYLVSLGLFLLGLPLLFKARLAIPDLLLIPLSAALIADAKVSGGVIYAGLWLTRLLFVPGERPLFEPIATLSAVVAVAFVTVQPIAAMSGSLAFDPLRSISVYLPFGSRLSEASAAIVAGNDMSWRTLALALLAMVGFFVLHFLPSWLLIGWVAYNRGAAALLKEPVALYALAAVIAGALVVLLFYHLGGAVYFFSNTAFFVALPVIVVLLTRQVDRWGMTGTAALLFGTLVLVVSSLEVYYSASPWPGWRGRFPQQRNPLVESLLRVRDTLPTNSVLKADPAAVMTNNPANHYHCSVAPFLFPVVSERPWLGVIPVPVDCYYPPNWYGQYGITGSQPAVTVKPQLLPGMMIHHWSPPPMDVDVEPRVLQGSCEHGG